ncbi:MAG: hypothetical protein Q4D55_08310 [Eubacteriales bacterium]|nr:hypothetical protein [Eubacteriales bacterium]
MKNERKGVRFLAAAVMTAALLGGQMPCFAAYGYVNGSELKKSSLIPENVTIEEPAALSNIELPESEYGVLSWVNGSYVPDQRVQSCRVAFDPYDWVDLSQLSGWDGEEGLLMGKVTVVVTSFSSGEDEGYEDYQEEDEAVEPTVAPSWPEISQGAEEGSAVPSLTPQVSPFVTEGPSPAPSDGVAPEGGGENGAESQSPDPSFAPLQEVSPTPGSVEGTGAGPQVFVSPVPSEEAGGSQVSPMPQELPEMTAAPSGPSQEPAPETLSEEVFPAEIPEEMGEEQLGETDDETVPEELSQTGTEDAGGETVPEEAAPLEEPNIFDHPEEVVPEDTRPVTAEEAMTPEEEQARGAENHSCGGISVSGIHLPWYVQFRVGSGEAYEFSNEESASVFQSYEFELWDLKNDVEYVIPDGEYISVTIPVKAGYEYSIEHLLDNGATETIVPSVNGGTMIFSTHSFSPFGIAGSRPLVGEDIAKKHYENAGGGVTAAPTAAPTVTRTASGTGGGRQETPVSQTAGRSTSSGGNAGTSGSAASYAGGGQSQGTTSSSGGDLVKAVLTGDETPVGGMALLAAAAAAVAAVASAVKKKVK